jgi:uncharacterized membrane protein YedE/YeeE
MAFLSVFGLARVASSADSGGYGSPAPAPAAASGGYGSPAPAAKPAASSGGYGSPAPAPAASSGGYGSPAPAAKPAASSGGYGSPAPAPAASSGGYGSPAPAAKPAASAGGYGSPAPAPKAAPAAAPAATKTPAAATAKPAAAAPTSAKPAAQVPAAAAPSAAPATAPAAPAASGGYGSSPAAPAPAAAPVAVAPVAAAAPAPAPADGLPSAGFGFLVTALLCGGLMGWALQRGRFCMNTAFRDTIFIKEFVTFRAFLLALLVSIIGANLLSDGGVISLKAQPFWPIAHILGGLLFGMGMVLAGGCGSGIWYRVGEGQMASFIAVGGFFTGIAIMQDGLLKPFFDWTKKFIIIGENGPYKLNQIFGGSTGGKWAFIAVVAVAIFAAIWPEKPFALKKSKGYYWSVTGLFIGLISVFSLWASAKFGDLHNSARGLSFTTPTRELFFTLFTGESRSPFFQNYALGNLKLTWGVIFIIAVPIGAYLSARGLKEFAWKCPKDPKEILAVMLGSLMMGFGSSLALGCNVGQAITGLSTLSVGSLFATLAIIGGNWIMVYYKFIKPMQEMED